MTVKLTYRELQRWSAEKLEEVLGGDVGYVSVDSEARFIVQVTGKEIGKGDRDAVK